jgi:hypothetical protein
MAVVAAFMGGWFSATKDAATARLALEAEKQAKDALWGALQDSKDLDNLTRQKLLKAEMLLEQHGIEEHAISQADILSSVNSGLAMKCPKCGDSERQQQVLWNEHPLCYRCEACGRVYRFETADQATLAGRLKELKIKQAELRKVIGEMEILIMSAQSYQKSTPR